MTATVTARGSPQIRRPATLPRTVVLVASTVAVGLAAVASLRYGARDVDWETVLDAWTNFDRADGDQLMVRSRGPRTVTGLLVGAALGLAGAASQGLTRNPMADPGILGINAGAAFAVVTALYVGGITGIGGYVWFALVGSAVAVVVVYAVGSLGRGGATPVKLVLAGAALTAGLSSLTAAVMVISQRTFDDFRFWQVGSVAGRDWNVIVAVAPFLAVGALALVGCGRALNGLALGDDLARGIGQRVRTTRVTVAAGVVLVCGAATALAGPIGFVGLTAPHAARALVGVDYRWVLPTSALLAAGLLVAADVVGRVVLPPTEVQTGVITAVVGVPVFVWLLRRGRAVAL